MIKEAYIQGYSRALEKLGFLGSSMGQSAASNVGKAFKTVFTKSVSKPKNLVTRNTPQHLNPRGAATQQIAQPTLSSIGK